MGQRVQDVAKRFIEKHWVHFVASDCHSKGVRAPRLKEAYEMVTKEAGYEAAERFFVDNPEKVLNNEKISGVDDAEPPVHKKSFPFYSFNGNKRITNF